MRKCSMAGCDEPELCGVGPNNEPMCKEHFDAWLAGSRKALDAAMSALFGGDRG